MVAAPTNLRRITSQKSNGRHRSYHIYLQSFLFLTPSLGVPPRKLIVSRLVKKFFAFCTTRNFRDTVHCSPSLVPILILMSTLTNTIFIRFVVMLSFHLRLGLPTSLFPSGFPAKVLLAFVFPPYLSMPLVSHTCLVVFVLKYDYSPSF